MTKNTVLITNGNTTSMMALADWIVQHGEHLKGVFITTRLPSQHSNISGVISMLSNSGPGYTYFKVWTNKILPLKLKLLRRPSNVVELIKHLRIEAEIVYTEDVNNPEILEKVESFKPEILLSFSATQRFKKELLEIPSRVAINVHYALLPQYAGLSPYFWYLYNREKECGVTLHQMVPQLDAGPVIEQAVIPIADDTTVLSVLLKQINSVSPMLNNFYEGITHENNSFPQDLSQRSYFKHPQKEDIARFKKLGLAFAGVADKKRVLATINRIYNQTKDSRLGNK